MPEKTPHDHIVDFFAQLTDEVSKVSLHTGKTTGQRMRELEWEVARLQADNAELQDQLDKITDYVPFDILDARPARSPLEHVEALAEEWHKRGQEIEILQARVKSQQKRLDTRDKNAAAAAELANVRLALQMTPTQTWLTDDSGTIDPVPTIEHMVRVLDGQKQRANAEKDERITHQKAEIENLRKELLDARRELTTVRNTHHEWVNGQRTKEPTLSESIQRINDVVTMQIEALSPTSGTGKVVDIRRRMLAKYSIQHDLAHLEDRDLIGAATALLTGNLRTWPWSADTYNNIIADNTQLPTAAALIIAHYDALREAGQES